MERFKADQKNVAIYNSLVSKTRYQWDEYDMVLDYLKDTFDNYLKNIQLLDGYVQSQVLKNKDITFCLYAKIIETVAYYMRGKVHLAYDSMKEAFESVKGILVSKSANRYTPSLEFGFKARVVKQGESPPTSRNDMFHIPFEKRHLVQDNRYSIHGIPSIYLGCSIYDCYCELGAPSLEDMWVSFFCFSQNDQDVLDSEHIKLVDLTYSHGGHKVELMLKSVQKDDAEYISELNKLVDDIILWPLIMSCSIVCRYPSASFKQEYIVPQMLYELCSENNEFTGIRYYSTKLANGDRNKLHSAMINYALPAQNIKRTGFCPELSNQLILTEPVNIENCRGTEVHSNFGFTKNGFPIIGDKLGRTKVSDLISAMDQMTMYFDNLVTSSMHDRNFKALRPLNGWREERGQV